MGHPPRVFIPGVSEHVMRRGVNRCAIVHDDDDRETFLNTVRIASAAHGVDVHSYVLMDTHYHLFVTPPAEGVLSEMMKQLGEEYVRYFNREYDRIGTLWTGRFRDIHKCDERQWYTCLRYIEMNPVEAAMVTAPEEYPWSSYRFHAYGEFSDWLVPHPLYLALGRTPAERQAAYRAFCFATDPATAGV